MLKRTPNKLRGLTKQVFHELYVEQKLSQTEIGRRLNVDKSAIGYWVRKHGIAVRGKNLRHPTFDISKLKEWEIGYLAGFIDGEGCIRLNVRQNGRKHWEIVIGNTSIEVIERIAHMLNYRYTIVQRQQINPKWKPMYYIGIRRFMDVYAICTAIEPYLIIKREAALKAIQWCENQFNAAIVEVRIF